LSLQSAIASGCPRAEMGCLLRFLLQQKAGVPNAPAFADYFSRYFSVEIEPQYTRFPVFGLNRSLDREIAYKFGLDISRNFLCQPRPFLNMAASLDEYLAHYFVRGINRDLAYILARDWTYNWACKTYDLSYLGFDLAAMPGETQGLFRSEDFWRSEALSFGRVGARSFLAYARTEGQIPEIKVLSAACQLSLHPEDDHALNEALAEYGPNLDPLWPALARHLARRATPEDRALLTNLAQHPEKREPPLSWGLRFIVRGDVLFDDGSVVTLDELCDEAGVPRLPYLEDLPDELEVDWED
jgi:hypothetical protein